MNNIVKPKIIISMSVDWEGEHLKNLSDLIAVRKKMGLHLPITHFICPNYFIKNAKKKLQKIEKAIFDIDEIALHIHPLKQLIRSIAGLKFRTDYNFYKTSFQSLKEFTKVEGKSSKLQSNLFISGRGVPLTVYTKDEQEAIIRESLDLLQKHFPKKKISGFRSGGWMLNDSTIEVLTKLGFSYDSSAVPPALFSKEYSQTSRGTLRDDYNESNGIFTEYVLSLWGSNTQEIPFLQNTYYKKVFKERFVSPETQPFRLGGIIEMTNNAGMSDFTSARTSIPLLAYAAREVKINKTNFFINIGFHQEGKAELKLAILDFLRESKQYSDILHFCSVHDAYCHYIANQKSIGHS